MSVELLGFNIDNYSFDEAVIKAKSLIDGDKVAQVITINPEMLKEAALSNIPVAIVGSKEEVVAKAVENLQKEISALNIVYYHNGYFDNDDEIYGELKKRSPKLILVALGSPRQEKFIYEAKHILNPALMIGIGGSLDVWSGSVKRAPKIFQSLGLEWLYRTITQPSRFKRIFPALPLFLIKVLNYKDRI